MHDAWSMMRDAWYMMHDAWCMMYDVWCNTLKIFLDKTNWRTKPYIEAACCLKMLSHLCTVTILVLSVGRYFLQSIYSLNTTWYTGHWACIIFSVKMDDPHLILPILDLPQNLVCWKRRIISILMPMYVFIHSYIQNIGDHNKGSQWSIIHSFNMQPEFTISQIIVS